MNSYSHPPSYLIRILQSWICLHIVVGGIAQSDLFISEYVEDGATKCIEIFNPTSSSISLDNVYRLRIGYDGQPLVTLRNLTGTISSKGTIVVCRSGSSYSSPLVFVAGPTGNDAIVLEKNTSPIDIIGNIGCDPAPADEWTTGGLSTANMTLVRKPCIKDGVSSDPSDLPCTFPTLASEWVGFPASDLSHLGSHSYLFGDLATIKTPPSFCGASDGRIEIEAEGTGLEYSINGLSGPYQSTNIFTGLVAGDYDVAVRAIDDPDCNMQDQVTLSEGPLPSIQDIEVFDPTDCGLSDGKIEITATGSNLEFSLDNGTSFQNGSTFSNLAPGPYDVLVQVSGNSNCFDQSSAEIRALINPVIRSVDATPISDCGATDGEIQIDAAGSGLQYSVDGGISWKNGNTFPGLSSGDYTVIVRQADAVSCRDEKTMTLVQPPQPNAQVDQILDPDCKGIANGSIVVSTSAGTGSFNYIWNGPTAIGNIPNPTQLEAGSYKVIVSDMTFPGCKDTIDDILLIEPSDDPPVPLLPNFPDLCELNGEIPLSTNQDGISGTWTGPGINDNKFNPIGLSGAISLKFTPDPGICAQVNIASTFVLKALSPTLQSVPNLCENEAALALDPMQDGISGTWSGPGVNDNQFIPLGLSGKVTLEFEVDPDQCAKNTSVSTQVFSLVTPQLELPSVCKNGISINLITLQDGILGDWTGPGVSNNVFNPAGLASVITLTFVPLTNQCAEANEQELVIGEGPSISFDSQEPSCYGSIDGYAKVLVSGGKSPFQYDWSSDGSGDFDDQQTLNDLAAGEYTIQVKDANGCITAKKIDLKEPEVLFLDLKVTPESQAGANDGSIAAKSTGGTAPYSFFWNNGSTGATVQGLPPGNYTVTVTDTKNCQLSEEVTVNSGSCTMRSQMLISHVTCYGDDDGSADVLISDGVGPFHFEWSHSSTIDTNHIDQLPPGMYEVVVSDAAGCQTTNAFEIAEPDSLQGLLVVTPESSPGAYDGEILVLANGGTEPYLYKWNTGGSEHKVTGIGPETYSVTITDQNGCTRELSEVIADSECTFDISASTSNVSCAGNSDGMIELSYAADEGPYNFFWSHDSTLHTNRATGLDTGLYSVIVKDNEGCSSIINSRIESAQEIDLEFTSTAPTAGLANGSIKAMVMNGEPPYTYLWSNGTIESSLTNLVDGLYVLTITDSKGCQVIDSFELMPMRNCELSVTVETDSVSCAGESDGLAILGIAAGTEPFQIRWSHNALYHELQSDDLVAGEYSVTIIDSNGCADSIQFEIGEPELFRLAFTAENETAVGAKDGFIVVTTFGGTAPFSYQWNTGETTDSIGKLKPGTYVISVTDARGCRAVRSTMINAADCTLLSNVSTRPVACYGESTGAARLDITTLDFPVDIKWSHDSLLTKNVTENLAAGIYSVTITDEASCRHTWTYEIEQPDSLSYAVEIIHQSEPGLNDGAIFMNVKGGSLPYSIFWDNSQIGYELSSLAPGSYHFTIVDDNGCTIQDSVTILSSDQCQLDANIFSTPSGCKNATGSIRVEAVNYRGTLDFKWNVGDIDPVPELKNLEAGIYWVEVRDNFCAVRDTIQIGINEITSLSYNLKQSICDPELNSLQIGAVAGGTAPYTFRLDDELIDKNTILNVSPGSHILMAEDSEGCNFSDTFMLAENTSINITPDTTIKLGEEMELVADIGRDWNNANFGWRNREGSLCERCQTFTTMPQESGTYTFYIRDENGCEIEKKVTVTVTEQNLYFIPNVYTINNDGLNDGFIIYDGKNLIDEISILEIFDRRGVKIYQTNNLASNQEAPNFQQVMAKAIAPQIYIYRADIRFKRGSRRIVNGDFLLLR